ncbi:MAG: HAMP domain-containing methyl-accepting chemotaxis protein [Deltaproteobacteria bacterium]|nr:HAMP domain-containing methyl-accepting chemotaxis protein [Deltaproteobacteria bacterium]
MKIKVQIGYKFIIGFILVVSTAAFAPRFVESLDIVEWLKEPLSFLIAILIGLILGSILTRTITKGFRQLTTIANDISSGDLTRPDNIGMNGKILEDESTELAAALNVMLKNLKGLVNHIKDAAGNLSEAAETLNTLVTKGHKTTEDISTGTSKIFEGALEQAGYVENASKTMEEMAKMSDDVSLKATDMAAVAAQTRSRVQKGAAISTSALKKMESILHGVDSTKDMIIGLEEKLNNIPKILDVITHISRQTDLLAINATIEASKAGEHGRGFAIVAEEVRRFADNTKRSVEDVAFIIKDIKAEVERLVNAEAESSAFTKEGREDINKVKESLDEITAFTSEVADKAENILVLTQKQKQGGETAVSLIEQIAHIARESVSATEEVDTVVDGHKASIEEMLASAKKLSGFADDLKRVVSRFKLEQDDVEILPENKPQVLEMAERGV